MSKTRHSEESEKAIEAYLVELARQEGFLALKYHSATATGYPDRVVLMPGGHAFWIELKSRDEKPRPMQRLRIEQLRALGFAVYVCDSKAAVLAAIKNERTREL